MLNLNRLPLCVLKIILLHSVSERFEGLEDWKRHIPLVGVCKQWTSILRSVVFSTAYIDYDILENHRRWMTNIDCIAIRGWFNCVKIINIRIQFPVDGMLALNKLQSILQLDTIKWTAISRLTIIFDYKVFNHTRNFLGNLDLPIVEFTRKLISNMPNIIGLYIRMVYKANFLQQLMALLVNAYSGQLQLLVIWPILIMPTMHLGSNLAYLSLNFGKNISMEYIMSICAEPLRELSLMNVPVDIPWHIFHGNSKPGQINFKSLQRMTIAYNIKHINNHSNTQSTTIGFARNPNNFTNYTGFTTNGDYTYKLLFPKLSKFDILNYPINDNLFNANFGRILDIISIFGTIQNILKWVTIPLRTKKLVMMIEANKSETATENTSMLNNLLNATARCQCRVLFFARLSTKIHLSSIVWGNLNELNIADIAVTDIITLLLTTPRLNILVVRSIMLGDYTTMDKVEQLFQQRVDTQLFALDLKELVIRSIDDEYDNTSLAVIYNIMTCAKVLTQIVVPKQFVNRVMKIIEAQKYFYPHFSNMHVSISK